MDRLQEQIRLKAYELYLDRGAGHGRAIDDWLEAERSVMAEMEDPSQPKTRKKPAAAAKASAASASKAKGRSKAGN
jgi:hypothetical protein